MDGDPKKMRTIMNKLTGLRACLSEMETSEEDLAAALGMEPEGGGRRSPECLESDLEGFLWNLANAVEAREKLTLGHIERVSFLAVALGREMGLTERDLRGLRLGSILHDIGKLGVPGEILNHQGALNAEKREMMQRHPEIGYMLCLSLRDYLGPALDIIRQHHEKLDGSGYPHGLKGERISFGARIMTVVDVFDALTNDRPYRKGMTRETALSLLQGQTEEGKLDKRAVIGLIGLFRE